MLATSLQMEIRQGVRHAMAPEKWVLVGCPQQQCRLGISATMLVLCVWSSVIGVAAFGDVTFVSHVGF
jgi:hypothetical protein